MSLCHWLVFDNWSVHWKHLALISNPFHTSNTAAIISNFLSDSAHMRIHHNCVAHYFVFHFKFYGFSLSTSPFSRLSPLLAPISALLERNMRETCAMSLLFMRKYHFSGQANGFLGEKYGFILEIDRYKYRNITGKTRSSDKGACNSKWFGHRMFFSHIFWSNKDGIILRLYALWG